MSFKYELHCHTKEVSRCGHVPAAEAVRLYKEKGYDGIVITDHYSPMTFPPSKIFTPQSCIDYYLQGYKNALAAADKDFTVLLGMELRYYATINDYLVYGITEDFLRCNRNFLSMYPRRFYNFAHKHGMKVLQAHPFRGGMLRCNPKYLDGCEIHNGKDNSEINKKAQLWAEENHFEYTSAGSDFHRLSQFATSGIITQNPIKTNSDLLEVLKSGDFEIIGQNSSKI